MAVLRVGSLVLPILGSLIWGALAGVLDACAIDDSPHVVATMLAAGIQTVRLSFGGVAALLTVPFAALTAFADPHVRFGLRFESSAPAQAAQAAPEAAAPAAASSEAPQVVSLDAFRRRPARE